MRIKQQLLVTISVWGAFMLFLALTNPARLPVVMYIIPFVMLFIALFSLWRLLRTAKDIYVTGGRRHNHLGAVVCASIVLLLLLQSIGQLSIRDVITFVAIIVVGYLYVGRAKLDLLRRSS
jgi:hypothetical protein